MQDLISRQAAIRKLKRMATQAYIDKLNGSAETVINCCIDVIERQIPSAQPDGIPLEWIDKHLEWLDNCDNDFAQLAKVGIRAMVEIWKKDKT